MYLHTYKSYSSDKNYVYSWDFTLKHEFQSQTCSKACLEIDFCSNQLHVIQQFQS